jgi:hypothetical protein
MLKRSAFEDYPVGETLRNQPGEIDSGVDAYRRENRGRINTGAQCFLRQRAKLETYI